jgi:hypothetical protein
MKLFLFVVTSSTSYRLQRLVAQYCVDRGYQVALLYEPPVDSLYAMLEVDAALWGAGLFALDELVVPDAQPQLRWFRMPNPWRARLFSWLLPRGKNIHNRVLGARLAAAQALLLKLLPAAVVVAEDGISGPAAVIAAARSLELKVVDLPYGYGTQHDLDNALDEKSVHEHLIRPRGGLGWLMRVLAPAWIKKGRHRGVVMFPTEYIAARESLGMTLRNAWIVHGGYADRILVESEQMMALYRSEGIPKGKLLLTGTPYCDLMAQVLASDAQAKSAFRQPKLIESGVFRLLVSWPTSYHASRGEHCEFPTYEEMSQSILGWLHALPNCRLTVSLHPAVPDALRVLLKGIGLNISSEYVIELIPKHDIYISYFSSTQRWAIACGKPVVNYDAYGVQLTVHDRAPGFIGTRRFEEFKSARSYITGSENAFNRLAQAQIDEAEHWGKVDGRSMDRSLDAMVSER